MTKAPRVGHSRLRRARRLIEIEDAKRERLTRDVEAALMKLKAQGEKPKGHELTMWDF